MTPSQQLQEKLDSALVPHGMKIVGHLDWPTGAQRRLDTCRWNAGVGFSQGDRRLSVWTMASWSTIGDCLRHGFSIDFRPPRGEADILVEANR